MVVVNVVVVVIIVVNVVVVNVVAKVVNVVANVVVVVNIAADVVFVVLDVVVFTSLICSASIHCTDTHCLIDFSRRSRPAVTFPSSSLEPRVPLLTNFWFRSQSLTDRYVSLVFPII